MNRARIPTSGALALVLFSAACASEPGLDSRIAEGRALLDAHRPAEAQAVFEELAGEDDLRTRMWLLRSWIDQGRSNDALDAIDALAKEHDGVEIDYLYGMAFARRAQGHLAAGADDTAILMNFQDAAKHLSRAVAADPERFYDAFLPLARARWESFELEAAEEAALRAVQEDPDDGAARLMVGRVYFALFEQARGEASSREQWSPRALELWQRAVAAYGQAIERAADPAADPVDRALLVSASTQLAQALVWGEDGSGAADAFGEALGWSRGPCDYLGTYGWLEALPAEPQAADETPFARALRRVVQLRKADGRDPSDDPGLSWWLGYVHLEEERYESSEAHFLAALAQAPDFTNAWYYVAVARKRQDRPDEAIEALKTGWSQSPTAMLEELRRDPQRTLPEIEALTGHAAERERPLDAAVLSEMSAEVLIDEPRYWNNLGLFLRDASDQLAEEADPSPELLAELHERALAAYVRCLELSPRDPQVLNDTAVILHYYLGRELERARAMYARARDLAQEALGQGELNAEEKERYGAALEDALANLRALDEGGPRPDEG